MTTTRLDALATLVLNADHRALMVTDWRDALESTIRGAAYGLLYHDEAARSPSGSHPIPSVMVRRRYVLTDRPAAFTRRNMFLAYAVPSKTGPGPAWLCALCGQETPENNLTFEHVVPRSKGGMSGWDNCCLADSACNGRKGDRTLAQAGMTLKVPMRRPTDHEINEARVRFAIGRSAPADWQDFISHLYWDAQLEG